MPSAREPAWYSCATVQSRSTRISTPSCSPCTTMPETIVYSRDRAGLPYSKGLTAQQLSASGLSPERSYELAVLVERRLEERGERRIDVDDLLELVEDVVRAEEGEGAVRRFHGWGR